jgi:hypothetical protein
MQEMKNGLQDAETRNTSRIDDFLNAHAGSVEKTLNAMDRLAPSR